MEKNHSGRLSQWRYRAIARPAASSGPAGEDGFRAEAEKRLAAEGLPWCFGEMDYPHWRRVPVFAGDRRSVSYFVGDERVARERALERLILCARCPFFDRCHSLTMARKSVNPSLVSPQGKSDLLAALGR